MTQYTPETFDFAQMSSDEIQKTLTDYQIVLTEKEVLTLQQSILKRPPTLAECILWSIQGSEHCSYKSSRKFLKQLTTSGPNVILGAKEDAGVIAIAKDNHGKRYGLAISHESHNHPSQIVPYEGAATGVGGNVRDVMCMGAEVIALADDLRFGDIDRPQTTWIAQGVVSGIAGYGNPLGIPNVAGGVYYDQAYNDNCLVTVVTLGIVAEEDIIHSYAPENAEGYDLILIGKPTDNSGFGGASFSSLELEEEKKEQNKGAVQEPNAFLERHLLKASYALFKILKQHDLIDQVGFKDLGAGGIACAGVELAESAGYGAEIFLNDVHVGMENLNPSVILCSETQERFMWVVPPEVTPLILKHYNDTFALPQVSRGAKASKVGKITKSPNFVVHFKGHKIVDAKASDVVEGIVFDRPVEKPERLLTEPTISKPSDYNQTVLQLLSQQNIRSQKPIYENYDKQVQGRVVIERGQSDAGVLQPYNSNDYPAEIQQTGVGLSVAQNPQYSKIDPYWSTVNAVSLCTQRLAAVGASAEAITDCLCFGNPEKPNQLWDFSESVRALKETCEAYHVIGLPEKGLPIVAGNVSFYNESKQGAIPASPMISAVGVMSDAQKAIDANFKQAGNIILWVSEKQLACGGSAYYQLHNQLGVHLPKPDVAMINRQNNALIAAIEHGLVRSAKAIAAGGLAIALAKMTIRNQIGVKITIETDARLDQCVFSEAPGFVLEVTPEHLPAVIADFEKSNCLISEIGQLGGEAFMINDSINLSLKAIKDAYYVQN